MKYRIIEEVNQLDNQTFYIQSKRFWIWWFLRIYNKYLNEREPFDSHKGAKEKIDKLIKKDKQNTIKRKNIYEIN